MKKVLLINNHSKHIEDLISNIKNCEIVDFKKIAKKVCDDADLIILSGGSDSVKSHKDEYKKEIELIKNSDKPILGICLGFELIAFAFKEKLEKMDEKQFGEKAIEVVKKDPVLKGLRKKIKVFEAHRWRVKSTKNLITLARSETGVEILRSPSKDVWGVQFHPEISKKEISKIIKNFINLHQLS